MSTSRDYRSSLRDEQARETRAKIRAAARELFTKQGFAATTIADIARAAGVSQPTIYAAYESKAGVVSAMLEEMEEAADIGPRLQAVFTAPDPREALTLWVEAHCVLFDGGRDVLRAAILASEHEGVRKLMERGDSHRRDVIDALVQQWSRQHALRPVLDPTEASEQMWLLTTVEGFLNAIDRVGWTPARYQEWLTALLERELLDPAFEPTESPN
jgi:TetR/AcrR family transcriptional regulator, regulator of cefoperazone and chloramphenicol sensitivity